MENYTPVNTNHRQMNPKLLLIIFSLLFLTGGFLRFYNLDVLSLWVDEVTYAHAAQSLVENGDMKLPSGYEYTRSPVYTYFTAISYRIFGYGDGPTRYTAALFGLLSILMAYLLTCRIWDEKIALLTVFFMVFSHFEIGWSRTARMYSMLQFLTLVSVYFFIRFVEPEINKKVFPKNIFEKWQIVPVWLLPLAVILWISYMYVHALTAFTGLGFIVYLIFMAVIYYFSIKEKQRWYNKYFMFSLLSILMFVAGFLFVPGMRQQIKDFICYTPHWASGAVSAQNRMFLFEFLISPFRFPLAAFFFIGSIQVFTRWKSKGILSLILLCVPIFLLSFLFTHRKPVYIFNVYPFFLMIAAYGFYNIIWSELEILRVQLHDKIKDLPKKIILTKLAMRITVVALFSVLILSPWLRITFHIPFQVDGKSNMAITTAEWKSAIRQLKSKIYANDIVISSHSELTEYYQLPSNYSCNWTLLNQAKEMGFRKTDQWIDGYGGAVCIEDLDHLKRIVHENRRGWILIEKYAFENENYIPRVIRDYLVNFKTKMVKTTYGTLLVFHWNHSASN